MRTSKTSFMRKAQVWSTDATIAVVIFTAMFIGIMVIVMTSYRPSDYDVLVKENDVLTSAILSGRNLSIVSAGQVNENALLDMSTRSYETIKAELGIGSDFCIHFEDTQGNLIQLGNIVAVGSPGINLTFGDEAWSCNGTRIR